MSIFKVFNITNKLASCFCISYLLLHKKICQNITTQLLSDNFCWSGIWKQISWVFMIQGLFWGFSQDVGQGYSHLKSCLDWRICLTELMVKGLISFSLVVGQKPQFLSMRASLLGCSRQGSWLPERKRHNNQDRHCSLCYDLNSEVTYYHINPMLNVEGDYTRWKYQEVELPGGSFGGWHHSC